MSYPITKVSHSLCNPHGYWPQNGYFADLRCVLEEFKNEQLPITNFR